MKSLKAWLQAGTRQPCLGGVLVRSKCLARHSRGKKKPPKKAFLQVESIIITEHVFAAADEAFHFVEV